MFMQKGSFERSPLWHLKNLEKRGSRPQSLGLSHSDCGGELQSLLRHTELFVQTIFNGK